MKQTDEKSITKTQKQKQRRTKDQMIKRIMPSPCTDLFFERRRYYCIHKNYNYLLNFYCKTKFSRSHVRRCLNLFDHHFDRKQTRGKSVTRRSTSNFKIKQKHEEIKMKKN